MLMVVWPQGVLVVFLWFWFCSHATLVEGANRNHSKALVNFKKTSLFHIKFLLHVTIVNHRFAANMYLIPFSFHPSEKALAAPLKLKPHSIPSTNPLSRRSFDDTCHHPLCGMLLVRRGSMDRGSSGFSFRSSQCMCVLDRELYIESKQS